MSKNITERDVADMDDQDLRKACKDISIKGFAKMTRAELVQAYLVHHKVITPRDTIKYQDQRNISDKKVSKKTKEAIDADSREKLVDKLKNGDNAAHSSASSSSSSEESDMDVDLLDSAKSLKQLKHTNESLKSKKNESLKRKSPATHKSMKEETGQSINVESGIESFIKILIKSGAKPDIMWPVSIKTFIKKLRVRFNLQTVIRELLFDLGLDPPNHKEYNTKDGEIWPYLDKAISFAVRSFAGEEIKPADVHSKILNLGRVKRHKDKLKEDKEKEEEEEEEEKPKATKLKPKKKKK